MRKDADERADEGRAKHPPPPAKPKLPPDQAILGEWLVVSSGKVGEKPRQRERYEIADASYIFYPGGRVTHRVQVYSKALEELQGGAITVRGGRYSIVDGEVLETVFTENGVEDRMKYKFEIDGNKLTLTRNGYAVNLAGGGGFPPAAPAEQPVPPSPKKKG